jgi:hypothetical protein
MEIGQRQAGKPNAAALPRNVCEFCSWLTKRACGDYDFDSAKTRMSVFFVLGLEEVM